MSQDSIILDKSLRFAARIVKLYQYLSKEKKRACDFKVNHSQRHKHRCKRERGSLRSQQSRIYCKTQISLKEAAETEYWLRLLLLSEYITETEGQSLLNDCLEIKRILISSLKTARGHSVSIKENSL